MQRADGLAGRHVLASGDGRQDRFVGRSQAAWVFDGDEFAVDEPSRVDDHPVTRGQGGLFAGTRQVRSSVAGTVLVAGRFEGAHEVRGSGERPGEAQFRRS